jgi:transposase-like protein
MTIQRWILVDLIAGMENCLFAGLGAEFGVETAMPGRTSHWAHQHQLQELRMIGRLSTDVFSRTNEFLKPQGLRRSLRGVRRLPGLQLMLFVVIVLSGCTSEKNRLDAEAKRVCAIDGGIKVFEKVTLPPERASNHRNGTSGKTLLTDDGQVRIDVPRDRAGTFQPQLVPKHERRLEGFDDRIVSMYARGMTVREIQGHLSQMYALEVSPEFISKVTDAVMSEVVAWQSRPLEPMYPVVFFDALRVKVREDALVRNKAVYLALGVQADGTRDVLGLWIEDTEGAKFWMKVFNDLRTRGVGDILVAVADGLTGLPGALEAVFPKTTLQTCVVHLIRNSLSYASWKDRKALAAALRPIYTAATAEEAEMRLTRVRGRTVGPASPAGGGHVAKGLGARDPVLLVPP